MAASLWPFLVGLIVGSLLGLMVSAYVVYRVWQAMMDLVKERADTKAAKDSTTWSAYSRGYDTGSGTES